MISHLLRSVIPAALVLAWCATANAKLNVTAVAPGIYIGSAPNCAADYHRLQRLGIRTIIDSRPFRPLASDREQREVRRYGMSYLHIPIDYHPEDDHAPHRVLAHLADPGCQPVYLHCQLGRDRAALVVALYRVSQQGWPAQAAYAEMQCRQFNPLLLALDRYFWQHAATLDQTRSQIESGFDSAAASQ